MGFRVMKLNASAVLSILCLNFAASIQEQSSSRNFVKICTLDHNVTALRLFENRLLAGTANALYSYGLDLQLQKKIDLPSEISTVEHCINVDLLTDTVCQNYIKVIQPIPSSNKILVCGTNAFTPKCSLHYKDQLENFTRSPDISRSDTGYSPKKSDRPIFAVVASNQRFFSATAFQQTSIDMGMSPDPLHHNRTVNITVSAKADNILLNRTATFTAVHEYRDHIYFFLTESAYSFELGNTLADTSARPLYSKVIRICKSDNGINSMMFSTFQKARIECSSRVGTSATYVYNEVAATFMGSENGEPMLYATFNAPRNGPTGGAICKYSFSPNITGSLTSVFEDGQYYVNSTNSWKQMAGPRVNCASGSRSKEDADKYIFAFNTVTAVRIDPNQEFVQPLVRVDGEVLGKVAAEVLFYKGSRQEVLYYSNELGQIKQIVLALDKTYSYSLLEDVDMEKDDGYEVQSMLLQNEANNYGSSLYINRGRKIIQIERGNCQRYASCQDCLESRDPYCGWHGGAQPSCVNKIENQNVDLVQSFSATESDMVNTCGIIVQPRATSTPTLAYSEVAPKPGSSSPTESHSTFSSPSQQSLIDSSTKTNIPAVIGSAIGTFILGLLLGLFICFLFFARIRIIAKRQTYQVQDKSKSNNIHQDGTVPDTIIDLKAVIAAETKEVYRSTTTTTPRYVEHALPQQVQPQLPGSEVKTNIIEVGNTAMQNSNVMDASPVKVGNGHIAGINTSSQPTMAETGSSSDTVNSSKVNAAPSMPATPRIADTSQNSRVSRPAPTPPVRFAVGSSNTLPHNRHTNKIETSKFNFASDSHDDAFAETDAVPPLVSLNTKYNSLGRNKAIGTSHGMARRQVPNYKVPKGRTDSTTWLRQESVSSDISPLQSPISDV